MESLLSSSPHVADQLPLYARGELRPIWRSRIEIEAPFAIAVRRDVAGNVCTRT